MSFSKKNIVKFLFPELQIVEAIKKSGFIAKPDYIQGQNQNMNGVYNHKNTYTQKKYRDADGTIHQTYSYTYSTSQNESTVEYTSGTSQNEYTPDYTNFAPQDENTPEYTYSTTENKSESKHKHNDKSNSNTGNVSDKFVDIRKQLGSLIIGQTNYLDNLCTAFKRPFVAGCDGLKPKNVIIILGNKSTGKHSSISFMAELLNDNGIVNNSGVLSIDLSLYPTNSEFELFLSDLYKCLYGQSNVIVVFDNFHKCHPSVINVIESLATTGKYTLGSRYVFQNNNLVEASGMLLQNSISEISPNGKYFIFTSEKSEKDFINTFGTKFMECVGDIIHTEDFNDDELNRIAEKIIENLQNKCNSNLSINVRYAKTVTQMVVSKYKSTSGINGMEDYVDLNIYKPLAEYKLKNTIENNQFIYLSAVGSEITAQIDDKYIKLTDIIQKKNVTGIDDVKKELEGIVGIEPVKQYILSLEDNLKIQKIRENAGFKAASISMHMIFTGNPGTGKTTIARIAAKYLKALGVLSQGQLREVTRGDLVGQYVGHTAKITNDVIKSAIGGVLFIDEAYSLCRDKDDSFGLEAIDTLVKGIEDNREDLVVILAGYKEEMEGFLKTNSGLKSRFPNIINFDDYTPEEMYEISLITAKSKGYRISEDCKEALIKLFEKKQIKGRNDSGNGRLVRNVIEAAILNQSKRLLTDSAAQMDLLKYDDFKFEETKQFDLESELSKIVGLDEVKDYIRSLSARLRLQNERKKLGLAVDSTQTLHMIFMGNPGTGKTMVARTVAEVLYNIGVIKTNKLIETDRAGLVAGYVGQTAIKTREKVMEAMDGVLFIDEAYSLSQGGENDFGKEAIDTLVKLMDDNRDRIVVILAGYSDDMNKFLSVNAGLKSRFPNIIEFKDYSTEQLIKISEMLFKSKGYEIDSLAKNKLQAIFDAVRVEPQFGNGRYVRNLFERAVNNQAMRLSTDMDLTKEELTTIADTDIERV